MKTFTGSHLKYVIEKVDKDYTHKEILIAQGKNLLESGYYNKGAYKIAEALGLSMRVKHHLFGRHFDGDTQNRHIFKVTLKKDGKQYTFKFGQSIAEGSNEPTFYDVLACLTKYDPESFEDFCGNYGYDNDSRKAYKTYKAVVKEWENMQRLFNSEELELLQEIN